MKRSPTRSQFVAKRCSGWIALCDGDLGAKHRPVTAGAYAKRLRRECFNRECWCEVLFLVCAGCLRIHGCAIAQTMLLMLCDRLV